MQATTSHATRRSAARCFATSHKRPLRSVRPVTATRLLAPAHLPRPRRQQNRGRGRLGAGRGAQGQLDPARTRHVYGDDDVPAAQELERGAPQQGMLC
eukprot:5328945-Prymnesium_polylepis.2